MARYNELLVGRFNRGLQKLLSMKGPASLVSLSEEVFAQTIIEDLFRAENRYLMGWDTFATAVFQAAVAANAGGVRIRNPFGSNVIAVVEQISVFSNTGADTPNLDHQNGNVSDLGTISNVTGAALDKRTRQNPTCIVSNASPAAAIGLPQSQRAFTGTNVTIDFIQTTNQEQVLLPDCALQIRSNTVNSGIAVSYRWRERILEESERT